MAVSNTEIRSAADLRIAPRRKVVDRAMKYFFISAAVATFAVTVAIIATLVVDAIQFLQGIADTDDGLGPLFTIGWFPRRGMFDIGTLVVGTFIVTGIAMIVAVPLGLGAAIYLSEYAARRSARRSSRSSRSSPAYRAWCSATSPSRTSIPTSS
jgi:phosphate transport system permease protein